MFLKGTVTVPDDNKSRLMSAQLSITQAMKLVAQAAHTPVLSAEVRQMLTHAGTEARNALDRIIETSEKLPNEMNP